MAIFPCDLIYLQRASLDEMILYFGCAVELKKPYQVQTFIIMEADSNVDLQQTLLLVLVEFVYTEVSRNDAGVSPIVLTTRLAIIRFESNNGLQCWSVVTSWCKCRRKIMTNQRKHAADFGC